MKQSTIIARTFAHYSEGTAMPAAKNLAARKVMPLAEFVNKNLATGNQKAEMKWAIKTKI